MSEEEKKNEEEVEKTPEEPKEEETEKATDSAILEDLSALMVDLKGTISNLTQSIEKMQPISTPEPNEIPEEVEEVEKEPKEEPKEDPEETTEIESIEEIDKFLSQE